MITPSRVAFTLIEMLLAMFILALGLVSVASFFPVATHVQRSSIEDMLALQTARSASALLAARGLDKTAVDSLSPLDANHPHDVMPVLTDAQLNTDWPVSIRCYPSTLMIDVGGDGTPTAEEDDFLLRDFYWVPLVQRATVGDRVYIFVLRRREGEAFVKTQGNWACQTTENNNVPSVKYASASRTDEQKINTSAEVDAGDSIVDNLGNVYQVVYKEGNTLTVSGEVPNNAANPVSRVFYGAKPTANNGAAIDSARSSTRRVIVLGGEVIK